jgi:hypothetical protein
MASLIKHLVGRYTIIMGKLVGLGLVAGVVYYYNTGNIFSDYPTCMYSF